MNIIRIGHYNKKKFAILNQIRFVRPFQSFHQKRSSRTRVSWHPANEAEAFHRVDILVIAFNHRRIRHSIRVRQQRI